MPELRMRGDEAG
jgi:hypothetical protein